ncbi:uncharacterized protein [Clytia hemisphaerica]|uniref:Uncharacterized protein n=1 Tax=Clytia hemisphaerica TaxID=252671 RepID=A0A7M5V2V0_9CNID|eukprot:TCONS_00012429-protein
MCFIENQRKLKSLVFMMVNGRLKNNAYTELNNKSCQCPKHDQRQINLTINYSATEERISSCPAYDNVITPPPSYRSLCGCFLTDEPPRYQVVTGRQLDYGTVTTSTIFETQFVRTSRNASLKLLVVVLILLAISFIALLVSLILGCYSWRC